MLTSQTRGFIGKGGLTMQLRAGNQAPVSIGNAKSLQFKIETDRKPRIDMQNAGGGELDVLERIKSVGGEMAIDDFYPANLAQALRGSVSAIAAAAVTNEAHTAYAGAKVFAAYIPDPAIAMTVAIDVTAAWAGTTAYAVGAQIVDTGHLYMATVAGTSGSSAPTWPTDGTTVTDGTVTWKDLGSTTLTENTHWQRTRSGIEALAAGTQFAATGTPIKLGYTKNPAYLIQALTESGAEYRLWFDGLNEVDSGNPVIARLHRVKFSPTSALDLIGDDFGEIKLSFSILKDASITTAGLSQYLDIAMV